MVSKRVSSVKLSEAWVIFPPSGGFRSEIQTRTIPAGRKWCSYWTISRSLAWTEPVSFQCHCLCTAVLWFYEGSTGVFLVHFIFASVQDAVYSCRSISRSTAVRVGALPRFSPARSFICEVQLVMSWSSWLVFPEDLDFCYPSFPFTMRCQMCVWCLKFSATICWSGLLSPTTRACRCRVSRALFDRYVFFRSISFDVVYSRSN